MKVLLVNDYLEEIGGAEIYVHSLKIELERMGHKVTIYGTNVSKKDYINGENNVNLRKLVKRIYNFQAKHDFAQIVNSFKPKIIHIHGIFNELSPSILASTGNIPVIMTIHNNQIVNAVSILSARTGKECKTSTCGGCRNCVGFKGALFEYIKRKIHRILLKKVNLFITPSNYMKALVEEAKFSPVKYIPNGFDLFSYTPLENYSSILYVGRLNKEKGADYLIQALPDILSKHPKVTLTIVGDGPEKAHLENMVKELKLQKNVLFKKAVARNKLEKYYKDTTLLVVPSIYDDNLPTVIIEAMSVGRPIVGTNLGGIPELIDHERSGLLLKPKNTSELAESITKLLKDKKLLLQMSQLASKKSTKYKLSEHIIKIAGIYDQIIKEGYK